MHDDPIRFGTYWLFADGTRIPVVSGGDGEGEGDADDGDGDADGDGDGDNKPVVDHEKEAAKWKALARKHEAKAKENAEAAKQLEDLKHAGKSEAEKLQAMLDEERAKNRAATIKALKLQVAADKGLPANLAKFLPDIDDEIDMMTAADELLEAAGSNGNGGPTRQPKSKLTTPLGDDDAAAETDKLVAAMMGRSIS